MKSRPLMLATVAALALGGCQSNSKEALDARLKAEGIAVTTTADIPRVAARAQIAEFLAKARTYPESYVINGFVNPVIRNARISGPTTEGGPFGKGTFYCVTYTTDRPLIPASVNLRAYISTASSPGKNVESIRIDKSLFKDCDKPYEAFAELEKRRDEIITFRKENPGQLNDSIIFGMDQL